MMKLHNGNLVFEDTAEKLAFKKTDKALRGYACNLFYSHTFRQQPGGITPSGDDHPDFVKRAYAHVFEKAKKEGKDVTIDRQFFWDCRSYILRNISRESLLKINNQIQNESYFDFHDYVYNPVQSKKDYAPSVREEIFKAEEGQLVDNLIQSFLEQSKDPADRQFVEAIYRGSINTYELIDIFVSDNTALRNEMIAKKLIYDESWETTEQFKKLKKPGDLKLDHQFSNSVEKRNLFGLLKREGKFNKPKYNAASMHLKIKSYQTIIARVKRHFKKFYNIWKRIAKNRILLKELEMVQLA